MENNLEAEGDTASWPPNTHSLFLDQQPSDFVGPEMRLLKNTFPDSLAVRGHVAQF